MTKNSDINISKVYSNQCLLSKEDFLKIYNIKEEGLTSEEAKELLENHGYNEVSNNKPQKWYNYFLQSLFSPFNSILLGITLILLYTDVILPSQPNYSNIIVILVLVTISSLLEFFQEYRSNKSAEKLKELVATTATVIRNNKTIHIPIKNIVFKDIVLLSAGSMLPADVRVIESKDLFVGQSSLTGESEAVKKVSNSELNKNEVNSISDLDTICFMGTNVISGSAKAVVIKTGNDTYLGKIADTLSSGKPKTAFQKGIESVSKLLIKFMIFMIPIVFLLNAWKHDLILSFTFAVAIAIGITPWEKFNKDKIVLIDFFQNFLC